MGKTNPTYRERLDQFVDEYDQYRRALRFEYQDAFDEVIESVHHHSMAGASANFRDVERTAWMAIAVHQQTEIDELRERVDDLEEDESGFNAGSPPDEQGSLLEIAGD